MVYCWDQVRLLLFKDEDMSLILRNICHRLEKNVIKSGNCFFVCVLVQERLSQEKTGSQTQSVPEIQVQFDEEEEGEEEEDVEEGEVDETLDLEQVMIN